MLGNFACFLSSADIFSKSNLSYYFQEYYRVWNSLNPDEAPQPELGLKLFAKVISR